MDLSNLIGFGVAGNFAGHLEQAGEAADFAKVITTETEQPKAIFPFYVPHSTDFLGVYPLSETQIKFPTDADNLQIEPELAIIFDIQYENSKVVALIPRLFGAYNDCSIRKPNAKKICEKKNWGEKSKGLSANLLTVEHLNVGGKLDDYRIACFHKRNGKLHCYGIDSPVVGYSYFHQKLLDWIIDRMNNQLDQGPMNYIAPLLEIAGYPTQAIISIGATRYTEYGQSHYLQPQDTSIVVVYNGKNYSEKQIYQMAEQENFPTDISALIQQVVV